MTIIDFYLEQAQKDIFELATEILSPADTDFKNKALQYLFPDIEQPSAKKAATPAHQALSEIPPLGSSGSSDTPIEEKLNSINEGIKQITIGTSESELPKRLYSMQWVINILITMISPTPMEKCKTVEDIQKILQIRKKKLPLPDKLMCQILYEKISALEGKDNAENTSSYLKHYETYHNFLLHNLGIIRFIYEFSIIQNSKHKDPNKKFFEQLQGNIINDFNHHNKLWQDQLNALIKQITMKTDDIIEETDANTITIRDKDFLIEKPNTNTQNLEDRIKRIELNFKKLQALDDHLLELKNIHNRHQFVATPPLEFDKLRGQIEHAHCSRLGKWIHIVSEKCIDVTSKLLPLEDITTNSGKKEHTKYQQYINAYQQYNKNLQLLEQHFFRINTNTHRLNENRHADTFLVHQNIRKHQQHYHQEYQPKLANLFYQVGKWFSPNEKRAIEFYRKSNTPLALYEYAKLTPKEEERDVFLDFYLLCNSHLGHSLFLSKEGSAFDEDEFHPSISKNLKELYSPFVTGLIRSPIAEATMSEEAKTQKKYFQKFEETALDDPSGLKCFYLAKEYYARLDAITKVSSIKKPAANRLAKKYLEQAALWNWHAFSFFELTTTNDDQKTPAISLAQTLMTLEIELYSAEGTQPKKNILKILPGPFHINSRSSSQSRKGSYVSQKDKEKERETKVARVYTSENGISVTARYCAYAMPDGNDVQQDEKLASLLNEHPRACADFQNSLKVMKQKKLLFAPTTITPYMGKYTINGTSLPSISSTEEVDPMTIDTQIRLLQGHYHSLSLLIYRMQNILTLNQDGDKDPKNLSSILSLYKIPSIDNFKRCVTSFLDLLEKGGKELNKGGHPETAKKLEPYIEQLSSLKKDTEKLHFTILLHNMLKHVILPSNADRRIHRGLDIFPLLGYVATKTQHLLKIKDYSNILFTLQFSDVQSTYIILKQYYKGLKEVFRLIEMVSQIDRLCALSEEYKNPIDRPAFIETINDTYNLFKAYEPTILHIHQTLLKFSQSMEIGATPNIAYQTTNLLAKLDTLLTQLNLLKAHLPKDIYPPSTWTQPSTTASSPIAPETIKIGARGQAQRCSFGISMSDSMLYNNPIVVVENDTLNHQATKNNLNQIFSLLIKIQENPSAHIGHIISLSENPLLFHDVIITNIGKFNQGSISSNASIKPDLQVNDLRQFAIILKLLTYNLLNQKRVKCHIPAEQNLDDMKNPWEQLSELDKSLSNFDAIQTMFEKFSLPLPPVLLREDMELSTPIETPLDFLHFIKVEDIQELNKSYPKEETKVASASGESSRQRACTLSSPRVASPGGANHFLSSERNTRPKAKTLLSPPNAFVTSRSSPQELKLPDSFYTSTLLYILSLHIIIQSF